MLWARCCPRTVVSIAGEQQICLDSLVRHLEAVKPEGLSWRWQRRLSARTGCLLGGLLKGPPGGCLP